MLLSSPEEYDYSYLSTNYHQVLQQELKGETNLTTGDILDGYITPLTLIRAEEAGLATPQHSLDTAAFALPIVIYPINPFTEGYGIVENEEDLIPTLKRFSRNNHYSVFIENLEKDDVVESFKYLWGVCNREEFSDYAKQLFAIFHIPVFEAVVIKRDGNLLLSGLLPVYRISKADKKLLSNQQIPNLFSQK